MFAPSRDQVRRFFADAWRKHRSKALLEGLEPTVIDLILAHPEYHTLLDAPDAVLDKEYTPENGESNPFLHLSLHLAIAEQVNIDQPAGIRAAYAALCQRLDDEHAAQHRLLDCLGEAIWRSQRDGAPLDAEAYLAGVRRAASGG